MTDFMPTTESVRDRYTLSSAETVSLVPHYGEAFDRWLAKVKADAIREVAKHLDEMDADSTHVRTLLTEADRTEKEASS